MKKTKLIISEILLLAVGTISYSLLASAADGSSRTSEARKDEKLQEVVVTAQKREERLQDVPVPVAVVNAEALVDSGKLQLSEYFYTVPGLSYVPGDFGYPVLSIRGLSVGGFSNPTVGIMVDEVPFGSHTALGGGFAQPDMDPSDLSRIEVLRGPQGTLYGASGLGGLISYVSLDPSVDRLSGRIQAGTLNVHNADESGYNFRGAINVPVGESFAVRASGFTRYEPGYIDLPAFRSDETRSATGVNSERSEGGRVSALWTPSDRFSVKLSGVLQNKDVDGSASSNESLNQSPILRGTGGYTQKAEVYTATVRAQLADVNLVSVSGYGENIKDVIFDNNGFSELAQAVYALPEIPGVPFYETWTPKTFSQEIRASMPLGKRFDWLVGAFYTEEKTKLEGRMAVVDPATLSELSGTPLLTTLFDTSYTEYALFTDLTIHFTDRFDLQIGGRKSRITQTNGELLGGALFGETGASSYDKSEAEPFTYLLTPSFHVSPDLMVYARLASGYRPGGPNIVLFGNNPPAYKEDKTQNYEIGVKGTFWNRSLSIDASIYRIDWQDMQTTLFDQETLNQYYANVGSSKSQGVELSVDARPTDGLTVSVWVAWNDAKLTEDLPTGLPGIVAAHSGDRLPGGSARFSGSASVAQRFFTKIMGTPFVEGSVSYVGSRVAGFNSPVVFPAYTQVDLRAGIEWETWEANVFVNNATDRRGALYSNRPISDDSIFIKPRTVGLNLIKQF